MELYRWGQAPHLQNIALYKVKHPLSMYYQHIPEIQQQDNVIHRYSARNNQCPEGIFQPRHIDDHVKRNQAAGDQQRQKKVPRIQGATAELVLFFAQRVCADNAEEHIETYADHHALDRNKHRSPKWRTGQHVPVTFQREIDRPQRNQTATGGGFVRKRDCEHMDQRNQAGCRQNTENQIVEYNEQS